jgi:hypothetical protein
LINYSYFTGISEQTAASGFTVDELAKQATRGVTTAKYDVAWRQLVAGYLLCFHPEDGGNASKTSVNFYPFTCRYISAARILDCCSLFCVISGKLQLSYITSKFRPVFMTH